MKTLHIEARPAYDEHYCDKCMHFPHDGRCEFGSLNSNVPPCTCDHREKSRKFKALKKRLAEYA